MFVWMFKNNLPTYVIVELLIRLAPFNSLIGNYKNHTIYGDGVMVKTSGGSIDFSESLVMNQFNSPELITDHVLTEVAKNFRPQVL